MGPAANESVVSNASSEKGNGLTPFLGGGGITVAAAGAAAVTRNLKRASKEEWMKDGDDSVGPSSSDLDESSETGNGLTPFLGGCGITAAAAAAAVAGNLKKASKDGDIICSPETHLPSNTSVSKMDYTSWILSISPEASANSRSASDFVDVDEAAPVVTNSPATDMINRVANCSFDTSGLTCFLHDVDTNTEATIPADPNALHQYNDIVAIPDIAYDIISRLVESHATLEIDNELNSQDAVRMYDFVRKSSYQKP
jgi:hypothetical protein